MGFAYDANGRVVKATKANTPDATTVYDALGNRVATKTGGVWQYMVYDAFGKLVAEYGIPSEGMGGVKYVQHDHQGSVRTVTNANGFVVARTDYQAFGENVGSGVGLRTTSQGFGADASTRQGYGLTESDDASGQQHTWFRKLEIQAGRWSSSDPYTRSMRFGNPQTFNRFTYVVNDPINHTDPSGLEAPVCMIDGTLANCGTAFGVVRSGAGVFGPLNTTQWDPTANNGEGEWQYYRAYANGERWVNMSGYSVTITTYLSLDGSGSWYAGGAFHNGSTASRIAASFTWLGPDRPPHIPLPPTPLEPCKEEPDATLDYNLGVSAFVGVQGGVQVNATHVSPYIGLTGGLPGISGAVTGSSSQANGGIAYTASAAFVAAGGYSGSIDARSSGNLKQSLQNGSFSFGAGTPSASVGLVQTFKFRHSCR